MSRSRYRRYPRRHSWKTHVTMTLLTGGGAWPLFMAWEHARHWWNRVTDIG